MKNKRMYEDRKEFIKMLETAKKTPIEYVNHMGKNQDANQVGKFIDEYYNKMYLDDKASEDPLTGTEINKFKRETIEVFNKAAQYVHGRDCKLADNTKVYPEVHADWVGYLLKQAISKLTNEIKPKMGFYLEPTYSASGKDKGEKKVERAIKDINADIALLRANIQDERSSEQSIGYDHYESDEAGMPYSDEQYARMHEAYAECDAKIKTAEAKVEKLEGFKEKLQSKVKEGIEKTTHQGSLEPWVGSGEEYDKFKETEKKRTDAYIDGELEKFREPEFRDEAEKDEINDMSKKSIKKRMLKQKLGDMVAKKAEITDQLNKDDGYVNTLEEGDEDELERIIRNGDKSRKTLKKLNKNINKLNKKLEK